MKPPKEVPLDKGGRVRKGRALDIQATARYYKEYYKAPKIEYPDKYRTKKVREKYKKAATRKNLLKFVKFFNIQAQTGRVLIKAPKQNMRDFAARFGAKAPAGSLVTFVPKKFAGKRISFKGGIPKISAKKTITTVHFLDFLTEEWIDELDGMIEAGENDADILEFISEQTDKFIARLPDNATFSVTLATGDYAKGSTRDKVYLKKFLPDLLLRFVKSKGVAELSDFAVAVNAIQAR